MNKSMKATLGAMAFAAPVVLGMAATAGLSVGGSDEGGDHTVDQWTISEEDSGQYTLDRESVNGVVTLTVTGPNGEDLTGAAMPDFVQDAADEFGADDWIPEEEGVFEIGDGTACYHRDILDELVQGGDLPFGIESGHDDRTFSIEVAGDGEITAVQIGRQVSPEEYEALFDESGPGALSTLEGAEPLPACE